MILNGFGYSVAVSIPFEYKLYSVFNLRCYEAMYEYSGERKMFSFGLNTHSNWEISGT